jgi:hypothetical protein
MEDIKFGVVLKNRSFPNREGDGGWGLMNRELKYKSATQQVINSSNRVG